MINSGAGDYTTNMNNPILDDSAHSLFSWAVKNSKQASVVQKEPRDDSFTLNPVINIQGNISLFPADDLHSAENSLTVGSLREESDQEQGFLALLLDPDDIGALIESNIKAPPEPDPDFTPLFAESQNHSSLKLEEVLHHEDNLDEYLPPDENDKWYLYGSEGAIDKAISGPGMRDIHDALLMQQLAAQNYVE